MAMDISDIIYSPAQASEAADKYLEERRKAQETGGLGVGLPCYIKGLDATLREDDRGLLPILDGDLCSIIARPGHGKTSFMMWWARKRVEHIRQRAALGDQDAARRVVIYVTLEQTVETLKSFHIAALNKEARLSITQMAQGKISSEQWDAVQAANVAQASDPLWFMGYGVGRKMKRPRLTVEALLEGLWRIESWGGDENKFKIDSVFVDYLQRFPYTEQGKVDGVSNNLDRLKQGAMDISTKIITGVQAKREVDQRADPTPGMEDGQWTSNIEQSSDTVITNVRPCKYRRQGETFADVTVEGFMQMRVTVPKQKMGESNFDRWVSFDPRYNELAEGELVRYELN
jgi:replicative DNA helicase